MATKKEAKAKAKAPAGEKKEKKEKKQKKESKSGKAVVKARVYQPHDTYEVGEVIKHPVWNDEGTITKVTNTPDGLSMIVVDFEQKGKKSLVVDYSLKI